MCTCYFTLQTKCSKRTLIIRIVKLQSMGVNDCDIPLPGMSTSPNRSVKVPPVGIPELLIC